MAKIALTGIKPTGTPHLGNYLGMIKPALELARSFQAFYFIADYHALTQQIEATDLRGSRYLACTGIGPGSCRFL
jgi:tryptophanyl-tRNA synthetase